MGTRTNYSYTYYGRGRETYDRVLKNFSDPGTQRSLVLRGDGRGEDRLIAPGGSAPTPVPFRWEVQGAWVEFKYPHVTVQAAFTTNQIRYPTVEGVIIFDNQPRPDYSELSQAFTNFFASLDVVMKALPSVNSATGTVQVIDAWSLANQKLYEARERFRARYPEVYAQPDPPPELLAIVGRLERLKGDYAPLSTGVGKLVGQFGADPEVQEAAKRMTKAIDRAGGFSETATRMLPPEYRAR